MALIDHLDGDKMVFRRPLIQARILRRPNRFLMGVGVGAVMVALALVILGAFLPPKRGIK